MSRKPVRRALISVSNKEGLADLARALHDRGIAMVATSGGAAFIADLGLPVSEVSEETGFPEILGGRVKTLHPKIHGGILARQDDPDSMASLEALDIAPIDLVVANLYPFAETVASGAGFEQCIEMIDIGGPTLIRAAAKNNASVAVLTDPDQYPSFIEALEEGGTTPGDRLELAEAAFQLVADYDIAIANWLGRRDGQEPGWVGSSYRKVAGLRYGENPHQSATLYKDASGAGGGIAAAEQLGGKQISFNNLQDSQAAMVAADAFQGPAVAIIKHANPCGIAEAETIGEAYAAALACDPLSAFGGVVALNRPVDAETADQIVKVFTEVVIAPGFSPEALQILSAKPNVRLLKAELAPDSNRDERRIGGGLLVQERDKQGEEDRVDSWSLVAGVEATPEQVRDLEVAWKAAQFTKSNAIVLAKNGATVGVGMGQVNRVDAAKLAVERANTLGGDEKRSKGAVAASDAFFPFPDGLQTLIDAGITAVVAPGGSLRDQLSIDAAKDAGLTLYFAPRRHFWH